MSGLTLLVKKRLVVCFLLFTLSLLAYKTWEMRANGLAINRRGKIEVRRYASIHKLPNFGAIKNTSVDTL